MINVEDIMVDDIVVNIKTGKPKRVTINSIKNGLIGYMPMRITPEILESNGFVLDNPKTPTYKYVEKNGDNPIFDNIIKISGSAHFNLLHNGFDFTWYMDSSNTEHLKIEYMHELQHAFKICRIKKYLTV